MKVKCTCFFIAVNELIESQTLLSKNIPLSRFTTFNYLGWLAFTDLFYNSVSMMQIVGSAFSLLVGSDLPLW